MRAATYARVSTDEQASNYSPGIQQDKTEKLVKEMGWQHVGHFSDDISGTYRDRPELKKIETLAEAGQIDVVVVVGIDRLSRKVGVRESIEESLALHDVRVVYTDENYSDTPDGELHKGILGLFAAHEVGKILKRTAEGRISKARGQGRTPIGTKVFGYHTITAAEGKAVDDLRGRSGERIIKEEEASLVREAFERVAARHSLRDVARWLSEQGVTTTRGNTTWTACTVGRMISNSAYYGVAHYGKRKTRYVTNALSEAGNALRDVKMRPEAEWIELSTPAIVSKSLWDAANAKMHENKGKAPEPNGRYPLSGSVFCGHCVGKRCYHIACRGQFSNRDNRRFYSCTSSQREDMTYCGTQTSANRLEAMVIDALKAVSTPGRLAREERRRALAERKKASSVEAEVKAVDAAIARLAVEEQRLLESFVAAVTAGFSTDAVAQKNNDLKDRKSALQQRKKDLQESLEHLPDPEAAAAAADIVAAKIRVFLEDGAKDWSAIRDALTCVKVFVFRGRDPQIQIRITPACVSTIVV